MILSKGMVTSNVLINLIKCDLCSVRIFKSSRCWRELSVRSFGSAARNTLERNLGQPTFFTHPYLMKEGMV